jgi:hypothetical protein
MFQLYRQAKKKLKHGCNKNIPHSVTPTQAELFEIMNGSKVKYNICIWPSQIKRMVIACTTT